MLRWTTAGPGPRLGLIVHHTDADREWAYDRKSPVGRLDKAPRRRPEERLDRGGHEEGLEGHLPVPEVKAGVEAAGLAGSLRPWQDEVTAGRSSGSRLDEDLASWPVQTTWRRPHANANHTCRRGGARRRPARHPRARACSRVLWSDNGKAVVVGRNLDWYEPMPVDLWVLPRGIKRDGMTGTEHPGLDREVRQPRRLRGMRLRRDERGWARRAPPLARRVGLRPA